MEIPRDGEVSPLFQDNEEYRVLPREALALTWMIEVNVPVEATGLLEESDGIKYLVVRGYNVAPRMMIGWRVGKLPLPNLLSQKRGCISNPCPGTPTTYKCRQISGTFHPLVGAHQLPTPI